MFKLFDKKDSQIVEDVMNELRWDRSITSTLINVTSQDCVVTLSGSVPHYFEKINAEAAAQRVGGVRAVTNEIEVNVMGAYVRSEEDIAKAAVNALEWNFAVPKNVKVSVENNSEVVP